MHHTQPPESANSAAELGAPDRLLRLPAVLEAVGLGRTAVLDRVKAGTFPAPIHVGRAALWNSRSVQGWIRSQLMGKP